MKFSLNAIKELVPGLKKYKIEEITDRLWRSLAEIEKYEYLGEKYRGLLVGEVKSKRRHPESEKLYVAEVDIGREVVTVVVGAGNFNVGDFVPYTPVGIKVPYNVYPGKFDGIVQGREFRGVVSNGMLNSALELELGEDHTGIMVLKESEISEANAFKSTTKVAPVKLRAGMSLAEALNLDDYVFEIENKALTHRGDCFSLFGLARDIAAIFNEEVVLPDWSLGDVDSYKKSFEEVDLERKVPLNVIIKAKDICLRYTTILLSNVVIKESPLWIKLALAKVGIKSINNIVDITNYVMLELGQPLHAFDYTKLAKVKEGERDVSIIVRRAYKDETIETLDNKTHTLDEDIMVIADVEKPIAIAGVIGGKGTAITESSQHIVIESANFDLYAVRKASMKLGIFTDAATVFSRRQDPSKTVQALWRTVTLLQRYANAEIASQMEDDYPNPQAEKTVEVNLDEINKFIGNEFSESEISGIFNALGFEVKKNLLNGGYLVKVPTYRQDISIKEDIYEEIARIYGYEKLRLELPTRGIYANGLTKTERVLKFIRDYFTSTGFFELINFNFVSKELLDKTNVSVDDSFKITNAVSPEVQYIRKLITPLLLGSAEVNLRQSNKFGIFEIGKTYRQTAIYGKYNPDFPLYTPTKRFADDEDGVPVEDTHLAGVLAYSTNDPLYYFGKFYLDGLFSRLHINNVDYNHVDELSKKALKQLPIYIKELLNIFKSGRCAIITANIEDKNIYLGVLGEVSSYVLNKMKISSPLVAFELQMHLINELCDVRPRFVEPSKYPSVEQDLCFVVNKNTSYLALEQAIWEANELIIGDIESTGNVESSDLIGKEKLIQAVTPKDIYQKVGRESTKQVTVSVTLQSYNRTLEEREIDRIRTAIIKSVERKTGGKLKE